MKTLIKTAALAAIAGAFALGGAASAQDWRHDNGNHRGWDHQRGYERHRDWDDRRGDDRGGWNRGGGWDRDHYYNRGGDRGSYGWHDRSEWRRGGYVSRYDWDRGYRVDWRSRHGLYRPPYGYEWRRVNDDYVLAAVATGLIAAMISGGY